MKKVPDAVLYELSQLAQQIDPKDAMQFGIGIQTEARELLDLARLWLPMAMEELLSQRKRVLQVSGPRCGHSAHLHTYHPLYDRPSAVPLDVLERVIPEAKPDQNVLVTCYVCSAVWVEKHF